MGDKSGIEWTDATWNPVVGCSKVSPGCANCYAEMVHKNRMDGRHGYPAFKPWTPQNAAHNVTLLPDRLDQQVNVERMARCNPVLPGAVGEHVIPNVWLGTSIENRRFVDRANLLRETPAAVRFISAEPLLGPLVRPLGYGGATDGDWGDGYVGEPLDLWNIDWLIVGGESGHKHRSMDVGWVCDLRDACRSKNTAFFFKQWGGASAGANGRELDGRTWDEMPVALTTEPERAA